MNHYCRSYVSIQALCMTLALVAYAAPVRGQSDRSSPPQLLSFQGVLMRRDGTLYQDGTFDVTVELYDAEVGGDKVYQSTIPVAVVRGVFNVIIGERDELTNVDFTRQLWVDMRAPDALPFEHRTKLTSAPYAMVAGQSIVAGSLSPDAPDVVRSVNGLSGRVQIQSGPGVTIAERNGRMTIDATRVLEMIELVAKDPTAMIIAKSQIQDSVTGELKTVFEVSLRDSGLTRRYLSRSAARNEDNTVSYSADSLVIPRYDIDVDGRVRSIDRIRVPRRPSGLLPNRVLVSSTEGNLIESSSLEQGQVLMGRQGGAPIPTRIRAGPGIKIVQSDSGEIVFSAEVASVPTIVSGRYTNQTDAYQYATPPIDVRQAYPVRLDTLGSDARVIVALESTSSATPVTITDRTPTSFIVRFPGGLAPGASINWIALNVE